jgi:hypothetical protein
LVRGNCDAEYHKDAAEPTLDKLQEAGISYDVVGGGRIQVTFERREREEREREKRERRKLYTERESARAREIEKERAKKALYCDCAKVVRGI